MRRNDWLRRAQQCGEHVANIEAPLVRGAQNTREHLLRVGTASRSIAAATDFARNHRRPQRLLRPPVRGVEVGIDQEAEERR